jgi:hypothetical protein
MRHSISRPPTDDVAGGFLAFPALEDTFLQFDVAPVPVRIGYASSAGATVAAPSSARGAGAKAAACPPSAIWP